MASSLAFLTILLDTSEDSKQQSKEVLDKEFDDGNIVKSDNKNLQNVAGARFDPPGQRSILDSVGLFVIHGRRTKLNQALLYN